MEVGTNFSDGARVLARIGDNQQMVNPIPIIFSISKTENSNGINSSSLLLL